MLGVKRGFTVIQFITAMTVVGLLLMGVFVAVAKKVNRDNQRRADLVIVDAMVKRIMEQNHTKYPGPKDADDPGSDLRQEFDKLRLVDPKSNELYLLGSSFDDCSTLQPGYISYTRPGLDGEPYKLRICLERGEYYIGD